MNGYNDTLMHYGPVLRANVIWQELHKTITCLAGFVHFHLGAFTEAKDLFM